MSFQQNAFQHNAFQIGSSSGTVLCSWYAPLSEPVRGKRRTPHFLDQSPANVLPIFPPEPIAFSNSSNGPTFNRAPMYQSYGRYGTFNPVVPFGWFQGLTPPRTLARKGLSAHLQQSYATDIFTPDSVLQVATSNFAGPTFRTVMLYQSYGAPCPQESGVAETITIDKYFMPLSDPVRLKPALRTSAQQFYAANVTPIQNAVDIFPNWFNNLSEPKRLKPALRSDAQQFFAFSTYDPIVSFGWFVPLAPPRTLARKGLGNYLHQTYATDIFTANPTWASVSVIFDGQLKPRTTMYQAWATPPSNSIFVPPDIGWMEFPQPFPTRRRGNTLNQFFTTDPLPYLSPEVITLDKWYNWLSEPVRKKQALGVPLQQYFATDIFTPGNSMAVTSVTFSGPVFTRSLLYQSRVAMVELPQPKPDAVAIEWFTSLSEPVRLPKQLRAAAQQVYAANILPIIPSFGYFMSLSSPQKLEKKGLKVTQQQSLIAGPPNQVYMPGSTGPLYINHRSGRPATFWKGRIR